jgi:lysophospholipase L1-like esterase
MVNLINENGADAFVISGYVVDGFMDLSKFTPSKYVTEVSGFIPLIDRYKQYQSSLFKTIKNAKIIKPINLGNRTGDGIHPNGEGQRIIANEVLKTI